MKLDHRQNQPQNRCNFRTKQATVWGFCGLAFR